MYGGMKIVVENESESNVTNVTVTLVKRVSERVAMGIPLNLALAGEPVTQEEYEEQLSQHPELAVLQDIARREFLEDAIDVLFSARNAGANIRWWLEHFYPEIFAKSKPEEEEPGETPIILGYTNEQVEEARRLAQAVV